jgi:hypothetical protein
MEIAIVVATHPGSNRVSVRLADGPGRVLKRVLLPDNLLLSADDRVLVCRTQSEIPWMVVARVQTTDEYGLLAGKAANQNQLHPPENFAVTGYYGAVLATWDAWPGAALCWEVQWTSSEEEYDGLTYTCGGMHLQLVTDNSVLYMRVRAILYDTDEMLAFASAWSGWLGARPLVFPTDVSAQLDQLAGVMEEIWARHLEGDI